MTISYKFKVIQADPTYGTMIVEYTSRGLQKKTISMHMPKGTESVDEIIRNHAPILDWEREKQEFVEVTVGYSGTHKPIKIETTVPGVVTQPTMSPEMSALIAAAVQKAREDIDSTNV